MARFEGCITIARMADKKDRNGRGVPWEPTEMATGPSAREQGPPVAYAELAPGVVLLGRFRLLAALGEGGLGRVFKARDERFGIDVLLKTLKEPLASDPRLVEHFQSEIRLAQRIAHPAVARTYDFWLAGRFGFVAVEFVAGVGLRDELRRRGALAPALALRLGADLLDGLAAAHELGVVHRDVKPQNIYLAEGAQLKIAHFGIAQGVDVALPGVRTLAGSLWGTPEYMSPEQLAAERVDARTDLYSAGLVIFEMLTGRLPFAATERTALATQRHHATPMRASAFVPALPSQLDELLLRLLHREREGRFPTAEAALAALTQIREA
jgi:eukaryotic-like serine/threonine-protein kinase